MRFACWAASLLCLVYLVLFIFCDYRLHGIHAFYGMANDINCSTVEHETNIRQGIDVIQSMIDISADRLEALRTQCATSAELTQQEIRTLETKLVKMFSELLITKAKLTNRWPKAIASTGAELKQWLRVVGKISFNFVQIANTKKLNHLLLLE